MENDTLKNLEQTIQDRKGADPETSYVSALFHKGVKKIAQKVGEEAVEVVIEAAREKPKKVIEESADLIFHLMVLWAHLGIKAQDVWEELESRTDTSGHDEKSSRKK